MIRILIVDDQNLVQQGIKSLLEQDIEFKVIGTLKDGRETIDRVAELSPDIVLLDIEMPGMNGITTTKYIARVSPNTKVIILSSHEDRKYVTQALIAGAKGYLLKTSLMTDLKQAILAVHNGYSQIDSRLLAKVFDRQNIKVKPHTSQLKNKLPNQPELDSKTSTAPEISQTTEESQSLVEESQVNGVTTPKKAEISPKKSDFVKIEQVKKETFPSKEKRYRKNLPVATKENNLITAIAKTPEKKHNKFIPFNSREKKKKSAIIKYFNKIFDKQQFSVYKPKIEQLKAKLTQLKTQGQLWIKKQNSKQDLWLILGLMILGAMVVIIFGKIIGR